MDYTEDDVRLVAEALRGAEQGGTPPVTFAEARAVLDELERAGRLLPADARTEAAQLRHVVKLVTELTHDTDGNDLDPDTDIPVGEVMRALAGEPL